MNFEYVALTWGTRTYSLTHNQLIEGREALRDLGWEIYVQACLPATKSSGACIMRRPKDEPRMWTTGEMRELAQRIAGTLTLWQLHASQWTKTQLLDTILGVIQEVLVLPASESLSCSKPRMWTEGEIVAFVRKIVDKKAEKPACKRKPIYPRKDELGPPLG